MIRQSTRYSVRSNSGQLSYMEPVVRYYMREVEDDGLGLEEARLYLVCRLINGSYVDDENEGIYYARHFVVTPAKLKCDHEKRMRRLGLWEKPNLQDTTGS